MSMLELGMLETVAARPFRSADATHPRFVLNLVSAPNIGVCCGISMTPSAGFSSGTDGCRAFTPEDIDSTCDWLQMSGVYASPIAAQVVQGESSRDGTDSILVGEPVCPTRNSIGYTELPIAIRIATGSPIPACEHTAAGIDLRPESFAWGTLDSHREPPILGVAGQAVSAALPPYCTRKRVP